MHELRAVKRLRQARQIRPSPCRLHAELLEDRVVPTTLNLTPIVPVSGASPFLGNPCETNDPPPTLHLEFEPYLAVDPTNSNHLVGAWSQDLNRGIIAAVSFNGGNTWKSVVVPGISRCSGGEYPHVYHAWVSFAPNGDVYLSSLGQTDPADEYPNAVLVNKSIDGGVTWGLPTTIVASTKDFHSKESITADPNDPQFVYATWTRLRANTGLTMFSRTTDGGQTWEPAREIFDPGSNNLSRANQIVVLQDGTLVNIFAKILHKNDTAGVAHWDFELCLIRSLDQGQTWLPEKRCIPVADIVTLDDTQAVPVPNPDGGIKIHALNWVFDVAVDPTNDNLYVVWQDARFSNSQYNSIAFSMSSDGGFNWSVPIKINQTPDNIPTRNRQAFLPSVAVNQDGDVAVTYYDLRNNTPDPGLRTDVWMVHAHPVDGLTNPVSWSDENRLTRDSFNMEVPAPSPRGYFVGDYQGLVAMGTRFGALWAMPVGTDQGSIFFRDPLPAQSIVGTESHALHARRRDKKVASMQIVSAVRSARVTELAPIVDRVIDGMRSHARAKRASFGRALDPTSYRVLDMLLAQQMT